MTENIQYNQEDSYVNTIIGEGTTLRGDFDLNGLLRIDGKFFGRVKTNGKVLVGKNGFAESIIIAGTVVIGGRVKGDIIATEKITLLSTGELNGNIKTPSLIIEEGVVFDGTCEIVEDKDKILQIKNDFIEKHYKQYFTINTLPAQDNREIPEKSLNIFNDFHLKKKTGTKVN
jgi:cytoskeletal protein CcmA (bactofilin family)